jgi:hypothetical protein
MVGLQIFGFDCRVDCPPCRELRLPEPRKHLKQLRTIAFPIDEICDDHRVRITTDLLTAGVELCVQVHGAEILGCSRSRGCAAFAEVTRQAHRDSTRLPINEKLL